METVFENSKRFEILANPIRNLILIIVAFNKEVNWATLKKSVEAFVRSSVNPNTLGFHIGRLIDAGFIYKIDIENQPRYKINENIYREFEQLFGKVKLDKIKEEVLR